MHLIKWSNNVLNYQKPENKWKIIMDNSISLKFITAILNSKLMTYFFSKFLSTDTLQGSYSSIYPEDLRQIPLKHNQPIGVQIETKVNAILNLKKQDHLTDITALESEIDQLVYQLYGLTEEEIVLVESSMK